MRAIEQVVWKVAEGARWLSRSRDARLLELVAGPSARRAVLSTLAAAEMEEGNGRPFLLLEAPWSGSDRGWARRADELSAQLEALSTAASGAGESLPASTDARRDADLAPVERFVARMLRGVRALEGRTSMPIVVVAPEECADSASFVEAIRALVGAGVSPSSEALRLRRSSREPADPASPSPPDPRWVPRTEHGIADVRWVVVSPGHPTVSSLVDAMGETEALSLEVRIDETALQREVAGALGRAALGAPGIARTGAAWPAGVDIPVRIDDPGVEPPPDLDPGAPGISPWHGAAESQHSEERQPTLFERLRALVLGAAAAFGAGRKLDAIRMQREAYELCFEHGLTEQAIRFEIMLGSYLVAAALPEDACRTLRFAANHAKEAEVEDLAVQAELGLGAALAVRSENEEAAEVFATAGRHAEKLGETMLAVEAFRMSGESAVRAGFLPQAVEAWQRAVSLAGGPVGTAARPASGSLPDESASAASLSPSETATSLAEKLAGICDAHGMRAQAGSLRAQAAILKGLAAAAVTATPAEEGATAATRPGGTPPIRLSIPDGPLDPKAAAVARALLEADEEAAKRRNLPRQEGPRGTAAPPPPVWERERPVFVREPSAPAPPTPQSTPAPADDEDEEKG